MTLYGHRSDSKSSKRKMAADSSNGMSGSITSALSRLWNGGGNGDNQENDSEMFKLVNTDRGCVST